MSTPRARTRSRKTKIPDNKPVIGLRPIKERNKRSEAMIEEQVIKKTNEFKLLFYIERMRRVTFSNWKINISLIYWQPVIFFLSMNSIIIIMLFKAELYLNMVGRSNSVSAVILIVSN